MLRIPVDFNTMQQDNRERVYINTSLPRHKEVLKALVPGIHVILYDVDLEVEAIVEFDEEHKEWLGNPIWSTQRDLPYP